jgi:SET and MYND domain-containing protein
VLHLEVLSIVISSSPQIIVLFNLQFCEDKSDIDEKQLVLYAQMANIVNFILQWPEINIKEIAENFSKVF